MIGMWWLPDSQVHPMLTEDHTACEPASTLRDRLWTILSHRTILATSVAEASQYLAFGAVEAFLPLYALSVGVIAGLVIVAAVLFAIATTEAAPAAIQKEG